jgi:GNAT superfamily N-acetyltransferase
MKTSSFVSSMEEVDIESSSWGLLRASPSLPPVIRQVQRSDVPDICDSLARAFHDDPVTAWALPSARRRPAQSKRFYRERLRTLLPEEMVFCDEQRRGAAIWSPHDRWRSSVAELARMRVVTRRALPFLVGAQRVEQAHPSEPHYYLAILGVSPAAQGSGLGSALLRPMLDRCDREGVPAYLESSKERNVPFYERHGWRVTGELDFPSGGPKLWLMWRDPR